MGGLLVLHTTEGDTLEGAVATLTANNTASHEVVCPKTRRVQQLLPFDQTARALLNVAGGVETNRRTPTPIQIEIVAYAADALASFTDDDIAWLAEHLRDVCRQCDIPVSFPCAFKPYPDSYGANNGVRLSFDAWLTVAGVVGHEHVPENTHGDPGDISRLIAALNRILIQEAIDQMALEATTPVAVSGHQYNLVDVLGWLLEGVNALRAAATTGSQAPLQITPEMIADELAKRLQS